MFNPHATTTLDETRLLEIWERSYDKPPFQQALLMLSLADDPATFDQLAALPIGQRDVRLLRMRRRLFGNALALMTDCPACGETLESNLSIDELLRDGETRPGGAQRVRIGEYEIEFRLVNSADLAKQAQVPPGRRGRELLRRCILSVRRGPEEVEWTQLADQIASGAAEAVAAADSLADIRFAFSCAACGHCWQSRFDVLAFIWSELNSWACRLLGEIHALARSYGWSERDVLRLSPWRRQVYLNMVRQ